MIRVLQTLTLALLVLGLLGRAADAGKPNVVILGLEVSAAAMDQDAIRIAKDFTTALRARATTAGQLVPHSDKELVDEKLIRNCTTAEATCIAPIGAEFSATYLIYGSIEKTKDGSLKAAMHMLNVATKQIAKSIPVDLKDTSANGISDAAKTTYLAFMGGDTGSININIQNDGVDGGQVTIGKDKKVLQGGHLTVKDLGPDRYTIVIEVTGFQRFEQTVPLAAGERKEVVVQLTALPGLNKGPPKCGEGSLDCGNTVSTTTNHTGYKVVGYSALILSAAAGGIALYETFGPISTYENSKVAPLAGTLMPIDTTHHQFGNDDCDTTDGKKLRTQNDEGSVNFNKACNANGVRKIAGVVAGVSAGVAIAALILAYRGSDEPEKHGTQTGRRKAPKPLIAVTPIIGPDGMSATVRIDF
jgi:hypothetical protein